ncbi:polynucleotide kinase-phosphatase [Ktedonosporobacter rubrisoli]|uniref:Polynucleotide kinase-phosphatase n=1 Tax=Ktedonosporobacter rubrisoli TaxID=2509675 RepID=A0A4P6K4F8_KTERU|nr:polynucleotide kinase-phosphatase [Ktedonosporobacter rubrisoli]QBD83198.1 polynucleotide kinase-phosphatase [Ktedonosporobacter rubrisoli]
MKITLPEFSFVVLIGPSGSGKSSFAQKHFRATEVLSSDFFRGLVADDENDQSATKEAFEALYFLAAKRLTGARLTVIDATNVQPEARRPLIALAREYHCLPVAIVFDLPEQLCLERNRTRPERNFGDHVVRRQAMQLRRSLRGLRTEGFQTVHLLSTAAQVDEIEIERQPLWNNLRHEHGPFDIIGDVHGCFAELKALLGQLGYCVAYDEGKAAFQVSHPQERRAIFLGDLVDRGPEIPAVLRLVMDMVEAGVAFCIPGNHDVKLLRKLKGKNVQVRHGLEASLEQLSGEKPEFISRVTAFLDGLISHYVFDEGKLVVAHAGMKEDLQGRASRIVRDFALYGETTGEVDENGLPIRYNWAAEYRGKAMVVYGHTPVHEPQWLNHTLNIDTGCVFGGRLTALRYPEKELVSVPASQAYSKEVSIFSASRPTDAAAELTEQQRHDDLLDLEDVVGKRLVETRLRGNIIIREENAIAALEVMSRFAANPRWLIYLPPTMSPGATSSEPGLLEHPAEVFAYYRQEGIARVICEEKHMGSRAILIVCRNEEAARKRFGIRGEGTGICYTRTGRHFFKDEALEKVIIERVQVALERSRFWEKLQTEWACLDCELLPWSVKAQDLVLQQYAAVGTAARVALSETVNVLEKAAQQGMDVEALLATYKNRQLLATRYVETYRGYCWPVTSIDDLKIAPFHLLATEGVVHVDKDHLWHMETLAAVCKADEQLLRATSYQLVDVADPESVARGIHWWEQVTQCGGEGMVVKPLSFVASGSHNLVQPAIKCRGPEYLRIIYGLEYDLPENLERLRSRGLGTKRSLAMREFALGIEALERFVGGEPLRRIHECVFGVLALESEPVDPRL